MGVEAYTLAELSKRVQELRNKLRIILEECEETPKWKWPRAALNIVYSLQLLKRDGAKHFDKLENLLQWPEGAADPKLFYGGKKGFAAFDRGDHWFEQMGFIPHEMQYTFTNTWDKENIMATWLIPDNLKSGDTVSFTLFFHGGGLCTGAANHIPWYSKTSLEYARRTKSVVVALNYPLGPNNTYRDIDAAARDFYRFWTENGYFKKDDEVDEHWTDALVRKINLEGIKFDKNRVRVETDSAGVDFAWRLVFINAELGQKSTLAIDAALFRYPMVTHYKREFPVGGGTLDYMGQQITPEEAAQRELELRKELSRLELFGLLPSCVEASAPEHMIWAFLLSVTHTWETTFQRRHGRELPDLHVSNMNDPANWDCKTRAEMMAGMVDPGRMPRIIITHGYDDSNCPWSDVEKFKLCLQSSYPGRYGDDQAILLFKVNELHSEGHSTRVGHAFDRYLEAESEPYLPISYGIFYESKHGQTEPRCEVNCEHVSYEVV